VPSESSARPGGRCSLPRPTGTPTSTPAPTATPPTVTPRRPALTSGPALRPGPPHWQRPRRPRPQPEPLKWLSATPAVQISSFEGPQASVGLPVKHSLGVKMPV
jgi:hypothetical protein